jgi:hypothetical protein
MNIAKSIEEKLNIISDRRRLIWFCLFIGALTISFRVVVGFIFRYVTGDWPLYSDVARNILRGCGVAVTQAETGACVPHFGGNQLPLFPAFVAAIWSIVGESDAAIRIGQSVVAGLAAMWLVYAVARASRSSLATLLAGLALAASPAQGYLAGDLATETLALAATQWVLAELLLSFADGAFRVLPLGLAMIAATWARMDGVLLAVPVAATALWLHGPRRAIRPLVVAGLIAAAPLAGWAGRNIAVGISPLPQIFTQVDGREGPLGYFAWLRTWMVTPHDRAAAMFFNRPFNFNGVVFPDNIYLDNTERTQVQALLVRLRAANGHPFPADVDAEFRKLAERRWQQQTAGDVVKVNLRRAYWLVRRWIPRSLPGGFSNAQFGDQYLYGLLLLGLPVLVAGVWRRDRVTIFVGCLTFIYVLTRVAFFALTANIEHRYTMEFVPFFEVLCGIGLAGVMACLCQARKNAHRP